MRFTSTRLVTSVFVAVGMLACDGAPPAANPSGGGGGRGAGDDTVDGGTPCSDTEPGCPCEPGSGPVECYPEPITHPDGTRECLGAGIQFCRDSVWSRCEIAPRESGRVGVVREGLIEGPEICNPCDPRCFAYNDEPTSPADVTPGNSSGVVLRPGGVGVELPQSGTYMGSGDSDGDGVPDDFDAFPTDPTRDGFTEEGGIFHMLPEGATEGPDPLSISTRINAADIYVLMDTTNSMSGEISNLRSALTSGDYLSGTSYPSIPVTGNESRTTAHDLGTNPLPGTHVRTGTTVGMVNDHAGGCSNGGASPDAVFRFTLTNTQTVTITTVGTGYDAALSLRNSSFGEITCDDDGAGSRQARISRSLSAGTYYVLLEGWSGASGTYQVNVHFNGGSSCAGILGAINCIIPDAQFGVGWFREYSRAPHGYDYNDVYRHTRDITGDFSAVQTSVNNLVTQGNVDWMESLTQALYSAVTGNGLGSYYPSRAANSSFSACPAGRWGYPCFREGAIPIVIGFTDAPVHEGPDRQFDYLFDERWPSPPSHTTVSGNETESSAYNLGDLTAFFASNAQRRYRGNTWDMSNDYYGDVVGCGAGGRDAVFRFTLTQRRRVQLSLYADYTQFDSVLSLFRTSISGANRVTCNDDALGVTTRSAITIDLDPGTYYVVVDGWDGYRGDYELLLNGRVPTDGSPPYPSAHAPAYWEHTAHALAARRVKFIGVRSCSPSASGGEGDYCQDTYEDLRDIALATGSVDDAGDPFVYTISNNGSGLSEAVVQAVQRLANQSRMDITARATDNPTTTFDERGFVQAINISNCPAARCVGTRSGALCGQCLPGTEVGFDVVFHNSGMAPGGVARTSVPQVFDFTIELVGDGSYVLDSVPVRIVVPPIRPMYPPSGSYWRDYDSTERCAVDERPDWEQLDWSVTTPTGTSVEFHLQAADDAASVTTAPRAIIRVPSATPPRDIHATLRAAGYPERLRHLRVTAVLASNAERSATPNLERMAVSYTCVPAE